MSTRRYIGGTRNLDGAVTRTVGVTATTPDKARELIANRLNAIDERLGFKATAKTSDIGLVRAREINR